MKKLLPFGFLLSCAAFSTHGAVILPADITITGVGGSTGTFDKDGVSGGVNNQCGQATDTTYTVTDTACGFLLPNPPGGVFGNAQFQQDPRIDGLGDGLLEDSLLFTFTNTVDFISAEFSGLEALSNYDVYINDLLVFDDAFVTTLNLTGNSGNSLRLVADTNLDFFYLNSLTVIPSIGSGPTPPPRPAPLPATTWLIFAGLSGLLGVWGLRKH
jgi:hypothetical protein